MLSQQISWLFDSIIPSLLLLLLTPTPPLLLPSLFLWLTEAAVATAAHALESSNGQVSESRSGAALRQSSQPPLLATGDASNNLRGVGR